MYTAKPPIKLVRPSLADYPDFDAIDNLLYDWFCWEATAQSISRGFMSQDKTCSKARSERQWHSVDELHDADVYAWQMQQTDAAVADLDGHLQLAIRTEARNRMGPGVWRNPRAGDRQALVYAQAKAAIRPILDRRGVEC
ncbi:hypothetical protein [Cupriavidus plantarum]|uniref:hypothetical protein n=1 Tax=Cupriavidus plantarum TaxID=942865 RepID=UPI000EB21130|nr:hypothetical protein [Cupriavidus plantarum]RLK45960.1 hypothetical protein C7417_1991 [Cupriavidus plantarum]